MNEELIQKSWQQNVLLSIMTFLKAIISSLNGSSWNHRCRSRWAIFMSLSSSCLCICGKRSSCAGPLQSGTSLLVEWRNAYKKYLVVDSYFICMWQSTGV